MDMRALAMGLMFATIWSSAFTSARIIVADASPLAALSVRFLFRVRSRSFWRGAR
jgi:probable blue pigment (indigoidine) exporter